MLHYDAFWVEENGGDIPTAGKHLVQAAYWNKDKGVCGRYGYQDSVSGRPCERLEKGFRHTKKVSDEA